jgi:hypothetical protein
MAMMAVEQSSVDQRRSGLASSTAGGDDEMRSKSGTASVLVVAMVCVTTAGARQDDTKALEAVAEARQAIGGKKLEALKSLSVQGVAQRNLGNFQITSDIELLIDLPDRYLKSESSSGGPLMMANVSGFNGDRPLRSSSPGGIAPGGAMIIRMGPGMGPDGIGGPAEKPTPEQQEQIDRQLVRSARHDVSRLMLGWLAAAHPAIAARYTYGGEAESPDGKAHIVEVKNADGFAARLFIDQKTGLPLMVTYLGPQPRIVTSGGPPRVTGDQARRQSSGDEKNTQQAVVRQQLEELQKQPPAMIEYALYFDDWRGVDGIRFPHTLRRAMGGSTIEEWTIDKVKINPKIDPGKFEPAR